MGKSIKFAILWLSLSFMSFAALATINVPTAGSSVVTAELNSEECAVLKFYSKCFSNTSEILANQKFCEEQDKRYYQKADKHKVLINKVGDVILLHYGIPLVACTKQEETLKSKMICLKKYSQLTYDIYCKSIHAPNLQGQKNIQIERKELPE